MFTDQEIANEEWRPIPGFEGYYEVSNIGRIKRLPRGKQWPYRLTHNNIRKCRINKTGYYCVNLSKDNRVKWVAVHRLVAMAFLPNPLNLPCINHKDESRDNNRVENLEWCTYQYNANYGTARERQKASRRSNPNDYQIRKLVGEKNSKAVQQFSPDGDLIATYKSLSAASEASGVHISTIIRHCKGKIGNDMGRKTRKFIFKYM